MYLHSLRTGLIWKGNLLKEIDETYSFFAFLQNTNPYSNYTQQIANFSYLFIHAATFQLFFQLNTSLLPKGLSNRPQLLSK